MRDCLQTGLAQRSVSGRAQINDCTHWLNRCNGADKVVGGSRLPCRTLMLTRPAPDLCVPHGFCDMPQEAEPDTLFGRNGAQVSKVLVNHAAPATGCSLYLSMMVSLAEALL
eukprot:1161658-Pelagomonas_calceolata.AAC.1